MRNLQLYNNSLATSDSLFQKWYKQNTIEGKRGVSYDPSFDYDYYSYFKSGNKSGNVKDHFPDTYKRPNHPTFSNESLYSTPENPGGSWQGDTFIPPTQPKINMGKQAVNRYKTGGPAKIEIPDFLNTFSPESTVIPPPMFPAGSLTPINPLEIQKAITPGKLYKGKKLASLGADITKQPDMEIPFMQNVQHFGQSQRSAINKYGGRVYGFGSFVKDSGLAVADNVTSIINPDIIGSGQYSDTGYGRTAAKVTNLTGGVINKAAPVAANMLLPGSGMAVSAAQGMSGNFVKSDQSRQMSQEGQLGSQLGSLAGLAGMFGGGVPAPPKMRFGGTPKATTGNVEKGELLTDSFGKILSEYTSPGMKPHPENGMDPRGNVPLQEGQFIIPTKFAKDYKGAMKSNDKLRAESIRNSVQLKRELEDQKAYTGFMKKYGGEIKKYEFGSQVGGLSWLKDPNATGGLNVENSAFQYPDLSEQFITPAGHMFPTIGTPQPMDTSRPAFKPGSSYMTPGNIPNTGIGTPSETTMSPDELYPPTANGNSVNWKGVGNTANAVLPYLPSAAMGMEALLQKPFNMDAKDYETPADLQARTLTGEAGRRDMRKAYSLGKYNARQLGGSGTLAGMNNLSTSYMGELAKYNENLENKNKMIQMETDVKNKSITQGNKSLALQLGMFNEQNRAERRNAVRQQGMNLLGTYYNQQANNMSKEALSAAYPNFKFSWSKK